MSFGLKVDYKTTKGSQETMEVCHASPDPVESRARSQGGTMCSTTSVVIADDHPTFRIGVRSLLKAERDLPLIGEASNAADAVERTLTLKPDILLLDLKMPAKPGLKISPRAGLDVLGGLNVGKIKTKTILFAAELEIAEIVEALELGACGVLLKDAATQLLVNCIGTVMAGGCWVAKQSVPNREEYLERQVEELDKRKFDLTPRELEIVSAVVRHGMTNKVIARHFKIAEYTVKHHLNNVYNKLGVSTRAELSLFAVNQKIPLRDLF
jgi:two-component system nitrate/nitrite response regulator NarL